jgi:putative peptide zinc metalloprotease protein
MRSAVAAVAAGVVLLPAAPAYAQGDTTAVAINTKDGFDVFRLAFQVRRATGDVIDTGNGAVAYASCTDCQTVALAIQVLLISGYDSSTVAPENVAIAINDSCVACETLASAYQFVLTAEGNVHFTPEGSKALAEIRQALLQLRGSDLPIEQIQAKLDALMDQLWQVLSTELVAAGQSGTGGASPTAAPSGSPSESAAPSESASATATDEPSAEPSAEPTASATESPTAEPSVSP